MAGLKIRVMKTVSEGTKKIIMRRARMEGLDILFHENAAAASLKPQQLFISA